MNPKDSRSEFNNSYGPVMIFLMALLCGYVYLDTLFYPFVFDDFPGIVNNGALRAHDTIRAVWHYSPPRFVTFMTFAWNYQVAALNPFTYHAVNIALHFVSSILVFLLALQLIDANGKQVGEKWGGDLLRGRVLAAYIVALIFLTHPMQTQAVTYIHQRLASLTTLFYLAAMSAFIASAIRRQSQPVVAAAYTSLSIACTLLAMFSKEIAATLPFAILLIEGLFFRSSPMRKKFLWLLPHGFTIAVIPLVVKIWGNPNVAVILDANSLLASPWAYFLTQCTVLWLYIRLLFLPFGQTLDHDVTLITDWQQGNVWAGFGAVVLLLGLAAKWNKKAPLVAFGVMFFFLAQLVESSFVPIADLSFEHRVYLPAFGFALVVGTATACALNSLVKGWHLIHPLTQSLFVAVFFLPVAHLALRRNMVWETPISLWADVVAKAPNKTRGYVNLGKAYAEANDFESARTTFNKLLAIDPDYYDGEYGLGMAEASLGQIEQAAARFQALIAKDKQNPASYYGLGQALAMSGQNEAAMVQYLAAKSLLSQVPGPSELRKRTLIAMAIVHQRLGEDGLAFDDYAEILNLTPDDPQMLLQQAELLAAQGHAQRAIATYRQVLSMVPDDSDALLGEGEAWETSGNVELALKAYAAVLQQAPDDELATVMLNSLRLEQSQLPVTATFQPLGDLSQDEFLAKIAARCTQMAQVGNVKRSVKVMKKTYLLCERGFFQCSKMAAMTGPLFRVYSISGPVGAKALTDLGP